eukprot:gene7982-5542_t
MLRGKPNDFLSRIHNYSNVFLVPQTYMWKSVSVGSDPKNLIKGLPIQVGFPGRTDRRKRTGMNRNETARRNAAAKHETRRRGAVSPRRNVFAALLPNPSLFGTKQRQSAKKPSFV